MNLPSPELWAKNPSKAVAQQALVITEALVNTNPQADELAVFTYLAKHCKVKLNLIDSSDSTRNR